MRRGSADADRFRPKTPNDEHVRFLWPSGVAGYTPGDKKDNGQTKNLPNGAGTGLEIVSGYGQQHFKQPVVTCARHPHPYRPPPAPRFKYHARVVLQQMRIDSSLTSTPGGLMAQTDPAKSGIHAGDESAFYKG